MKKDPLADILSVPESKNALSEREKVIQILNVLKSDLTQRFYRNYNVPNEDQELAYYIQDLIPQIRKIKKEVNNLDDFRKLLGK